MPQDWAAILAAPPPSTPEAWRQVLALDAREAASGLPPGLATAVLRQESNGNPRALNRSTGAAGLWQLMPDIARAHRVDPYDPVPATDAALKELGTLYATYDGDLPKTLAGYNWGQGRVARLGLAKAPQETRDYIATITGWLTPRSAEAAPAGRDWNKELFGTPAPTTATPQAPNPPAYVGQAGRPLAPGEAVPTSPPLPRTAYGMPVEPGLVPTESPVDLAASLYTGTLGAKAGARLGTYVGAPLLGTGLGLEAAYKVQQATGSAPGSPLDVGLPDVLNVALPAAATAVIAPIHGIKNLGVRAVGTGAQGAIDTAATKTAAQAARLTEAEAAATEANDAAQAAYSARGAAAANDARMAAQAAQQRYEAELAAYQMAVGAQERAVGTARAVPATVKPDTPSWVTYQKLRDSAPKAPVDITPAQEAAARLASELGERLPTAQPSRLQSLLTDLQERETTTTLGVVHDDLKVLGPLTRSADGTTRRVAKQLYGALQDSLEAAADQLPATAAGRDLLLTANAAARREFAVQDLERIVRQAVTIGDDGLPRLAPGRLLTQFDRLAETDALFRGSFTPAELTGLRADIAGLANTPKIPSGLPQAPGPTMPKYVAPPPEPVVSARLASLRGQPPVEPDYPSPSAARILAEIGGGFGTGLLTGHPLKGALIGGAMASADELYAILSRALLTPRGRAILAAAQEPGGRISPAALAALAEVVKLPGRNTSQDQRFGR